MNTATYYRALVDIEDRVALEQARRDVAARCGMAFDDQDSAEKVYRAGLEYCGIAKTETRGLDVRALKMLLQTRPLPGSQAWRNAPGLAFDSNPRREKSARRYPRRRDSAARPV